MVSLLNLFILFHRLMIFKMLALEQFAEKWPFSAGGGASDRSDPLDKARGYV